MKWRLSFCDFPVDVVDDADEDPNDFMNRTHHEYVRGMFAAGKLPVTVRHWTCSPLPEGSTVNKLERTAALASIIAGPAAVAGIMGGFRARPTPDDLAREVEANAKHVAGIVVRADKNRRERAARVTEKRIAAACAQLRRDGHVDSEKKNHELVEENFVEVKCVTIDALTTRCGGPVRGFGLASIDVALEAAENHLRPFPCPACLRAEKASK